MWRGGGLKREMEDGNIGEMGDGNMGEMGDGNTGEMGDGNMGEMGAGNMGEMGDGNMDMWREGKGSPRHNRLPHEISRLLPRPLTCAFPLTPRKTSCLPSLAEPTLALVFCFSARIATEWRRVGRLTDAAMRRRPGGEKQQGTGVGPMENGGT